MVVFQKSARLKTKIMKEFDVVIIGAGLAGLQCAKLLARRGAKILLVDRKTDLSKGVHTTGIFVRKTFEDFDFPDGTLGKPIRNVTLYSPKLKAVNLESEKDEFRVGKMGLIYDEFLQDCVADGVRCARATLYKGAEISGGETIVNLEKRGEAYSVKTKVLIGADGANSHVAKDLQLDENKEWIVGYEEVFHSKNANRVVRLSVRRQKIKSRQTSVKSMKYRLLDSADALYKSLSSHRHRFQNQREQN